MTAAAPVLFFGPYLPPRHRRIGDWITDELHGEVQVNGWTDAPLSWPTRKRPGGGPRSIAVTADLVRAIQSESVVAVAHWFGISTKRVTELRRALHVARNTAGTLRQHAAVAELPPAEAAAKGRARIQADPALRMKGVEAWRGHTHSTESREKMSLAQRGRSKPKGWGAQANAWMLEGRNRKRGARRS